MAGRLGPVFVSYAHQGTGSQYLDLCRKVVDLAGLDLDIWTDQRIESGDQWQQEIELALASCSAALLLIDIDFLLSHYVTRKELPKLFTAAAGVAAAVGGESFASRIPLIPILVEECPYDQKLPWLNHLQLEPEQSLRNRIDTRTAGAGRFLTLDQLSKPQLASFMTALAKRLGTDVRPRVVVPVRPGTGAAAVNREAEPPIIADESKPYARYLTRGEDLYGNYVNLQINLAHAEFDTYRLEVRQGYRDGFESFGESYCGLVGLHVESATGAADGGINANHPGQEILRVPLSMCADSRVPAGNVNECITRARGKARELGLPLQLHIGINANAGELHQIPWETLPLDGDQAAARIQRILFSRTALSAGDDAVEGQTRACDALRVLTVYSDAGTNGAAASDPLQQRPILEAMLESIGSLQPDIRASTDLLRPDADVLLDHLSAGSAYDVLYLACEAEKREHEYYLKLADRDLSRAELVGHFRSAPVPRLLVLVPAHLLAGAPENSDSVHALMHFSALFARLGSASVITSQHAMSAATWNRFLQACFSALAEHGHVPGAVAEARRSSLEGSDWWYPVLISRVKAARLWYRPGFVSDERPEANWESLQSSLANGRFCPIIGPGIHYRLQEARLALAREMADEYDYPLSFAFRINLPAVAQFVRTLEPNKNVFVSKLEKKIRSRLLRLAGLGNSVREELPLHELAYTIALELLKQEPDNPYNILARLPVGLYMTTNLDPFLEAALELVRQNTHRKTDPPIDEVSVFDFSKVDPDRVDIGGSTVLPRTEFEPTHPILVQLFGSYRELGNAAIAEDDYFQFLATFAQRMADVKGPLEGKLGESDLVFLGFKWNSLGFRVLFRALQKYANTMPEESFHIAVQVDPDDDVTIHPDKALEYLRRYFSGRKHLQQARISLYWGSTGDFLKDLESRLLERNGV